MAKKQLRFIAIFMGLFVQHQAIAQETMHLTMREAILIGLRYNQNVQNSELQRIIDKFSIAVAENAFQFQYSVSGNVNSAAVMADANPWIKARDYTLSTAISRRTMFGTQFNLQVTHPLGWASGQGSYLFNPAAALTVSQPLLRGSGVLINTAPLMQTYNTEGINQLNYKNTVINTITTIITNYRGIVLAENTLIVDKQALKSAQQTVDQNNLRIKNGLMAPSENVQAEFAVAQQELQVITDINSIIQAKLQLLQSIGLSPGRKITIDNEISTDDVHYPVGDEATRILFTHNISYLSALLAIQNNKLGLLQAEDSQRWQLDFTATVGQGPGSGGGDNAGYKSLFNGRNVNRAIGLTFDIPIDDLQSQSNVVNAKVGYDQAELLLKQLRMQLESSLIGTLAQLEIARKQIVIAKKTQDLANKSYQDSLIKLKYGKVSLFEVTTLQSNLVASQLSYISTQISFLNSVTAYQQNLGITLDVWNIHLKC